MSDVLGDSSNALIRQAMLSHLRAMEAEVESVRKKLGISPPGVIWTHHDDGDRRLEVEADGHGGASLLFMKGIGGDNDIVLEQRTFEDERKACALAERYTDFDHENGDLELEELFDEKTYPESSIQIT
jgi:hypothetical protein